MATTPSIATPPTSLCHSRASSACTAASCLPCPRRRLSYSSSPAGQALSLSRPSSAARFISVLSASSSRSVKRNAILALDPDFYRIPHKSGVPVGSRMFVWNLPPNLDQEAFMDWFNSINLPVVSFELTDDPELNAQGIGGFIEFQNTQDACMAIVKRDGSKFNGRCIRFDFVEKKPHETPIGTGRRNRFRSMGGGYETRPNPNYVARNPNYVSNTNYANQTQSYGTQTGSSGFGSNPAASNYASGTGTSGNSQSAPLYGGASPSQTAYGGSNPVEAQPSPSYGASTGLATTVGQSVPSYASSPSPATGPVDHSAPSHANSTYLNSPSPATGPVGQSIPSYVSSPSPAAASMGQSGPSYVTGPSPAIGSMGQSAPSYVTGASPATGSVGQSGPSYMTGPSPATGSLSHPAPSYTSGSSAITGSVSQSVPSYVNGPTPASGSVSQSVPNYVNGPTPATGSVGQSASSYENSPTAVTGSNYGSSSQSYGSASSGYVEAQAPNSFSNPVYGNTSSSNFDSIGTSSGYGAASGYGNPSYGGSGSFISTAPPRNSGESYGTSDTSGFGSPNYSYGGSTYGSRPFSANRLFVGNLPWSADEMQLQELFSRHGNVLEARVVKDRETGRSRGFGFVSMSTADEMQAAIQALDGTPMDGRPLRVNEANARF